ncbi:DUF4397 domain-containing protein [Halococcus saccharolyticus]|nr:DUF4397 domain-containing protein [Halococcus saccharolyticus]
MSKKIFGESGTVFPSRRVLAVGLVALALVLAGCGGGGDGGGNGTAGEATDAAGETTAAADEATEAADETTEMDETTEAGETTEAAETTEAGETTMGETTMGETTMAETTAMNGSGGMDGNASLRVAHMSPDAPNVDVYVNNETFLEDVPFGTISNYTSVPPGEYAVAITAAGNRSAEVFSGNVTVEEAAYTVTATGEISEDAETSFAPLILEDEAASGENASVRVVHVSPDAGPVDVTVNSTGAAIADNATFGNATDYVEVPAGDYTLDIRGATADNDGPIVASVDVSVEGGTAYSAFAAGYVAPDDAPADTPFEVILTTDGMTASMSNGTAATTTEAES